MLRNAGRVGSSNARPISVIGLLVLIMLWAWKLRAPAISPAFPSDSVPSVPSDLNTSWHKQISKEHLATDNNGLTGVSTPLGILDRTRVAVLIEDRPLPYLIPLLLHFISVVPPEWSFRFMGSQDSIKMMESNPIVRRYIEAKKLFLDLIPYHIVPNVNVSTAYYLIFFVAFCELP